MKRAFTLIELVLVLVILSVLATIAIESIEPQVDQARFETTQSMLENVNRAILSETRSAGGQSQYSGFLSDMGRLPRAREASPGSDTLTLSELWLQASLPAFQTIPAVAANLKPGNDADGDMIDEDTTVSLSFGWRGPYVTFAPGVSLGTNSLVDGWGSPITASQTLSDQSRLRGFDNAGNEIEINTVSQPIAFARSFGRDNAQDVLANADPYDNDLPAIGTVPAASRLTGQVRGTVYVVNEVEVDQIEVRLFYPDGDTDGRIALQVAKGDGGAATQEVSGHLPAASPGSFKAFHYRFDDGTGNDLDFFVGTRVIRAYDVSTGAEAQSVPLTIQIRPGQNTIDLTINN